MEFILSILRIAQLLMLVILTGLIGNVIATNINAAGSATAAVNFTMFAIVLSWLAALFGLATNLAASLSSSSFVSTARLGLDGAATLFTFVAAIVLAAKVRATNCAGELTGANLGDDWIGFGSANNEKRCRELQAGTAFMWFLFAVLAASLFFTLTGWRKTGGSVRSGPHSVMSQVRV